MNHLAADQLDQLAQNSSGAIQVLGNRETKGWTHLTVSLDTHGIDRDPSGIHIRGREKFTISAPDTFPYKPPSVWVDHNRWAGTAHVQWGRHLCIYAAPSVEWDPADGMRGLIARLSLWLQNAGAGTLDPDGQPLHPPVAYADAAAGRIIIHPDLGSLVPWSPEQKTSVPTVVFAWCVQTDDRVDVVHWHTYMETLDRILAEDFAPLDSGSRPYFVAPCVLIHDQIGFEYPSTATDLADSLHSSGLSRDELLLWLSRAGMINSHLTAKSSETSPPPTPNIVLLGTPSRRVEGTTMLAHLSAWKLDDLGTQISELLADTEFGVLKDMKPKVMELANSWLGFAKTAWMTVHEDRPEVTRRRDTNTPTAWLMGKRVLVLGCGALGAPIAEHLVRSGVSGLSVADKSAVGPGILVRQPYYDADIGQPKAAVLAARLSNIRRDLDVIPLAGEILTGILAPDSEPPQFDLIIDATADTGVRTAIEHSRSRLRHAWPHLVTVIIGHRAERGLVIISPAQTSGGALDVLRRVSINARSEAATDWLDIANDFFPSTPRGDLFFPEPGCSAPTFVGSSAQVGSLGASMLTGALIALTTATAEPGTVAPMTAIAVRLPGSEPAGTSTMTWPSDILVSDANANGSVEDFEIRISHAAMAEMRAEARRGFRLRGPQIETGGMLLGAFDDAARVVNIDVATGPPPDSALSSLYFDHGTEGTQEILDHHRLVSANTIAFVGMWHTHPLGRASPSPTDEFGMARILDFTGTGRRSVMLILGGDHTVWTKWRDSDGAPDIYARVVERGMSIPTRTLRIGPPTDASWFPGGYGYDPHAAAPQHRWWKTAKARE